MEALIEMAVNVLRPQKNIFMQTNTNNDMINI